MLTSDNTNITELGYLIKNLYLSANKISVNKYYKLLIFIQLTDSPTKYSSDWRLFNGEFTSC